jgi:hypothetical protein
MISLEIFGILIKSDSAVRDVECEIKMPPKNGVQ